jgi:hypothetical protein
MDYAVAATVDWPNVRAWAETLAAVFAALGTVAAFFATYRAVKVQEQTLKLQALSSISNGRTWPTRDASE